MSNNAHPAPFGEQEAVTHAKEIVDKVWVDNHLDCDALEDQLTQALLSAWASGHSSQVPELNRLNNDNAELQRELAAVAEKASELEEALTAQTALVAELQAKAANLSMRLNKYRGVFYNLRIRQQIALDKMEDKNSQKASMTELFIEALTWIIESPQPGGGGDGR